MSEFDRKTLISMYKEKIIRDHKIPTARDINSDYFFPSYSEFKKKFNGKKIREVKELSDLIKYYRLIFKIEKTFCDDCIYDKKSCGKTIEECKKKDELYFKNLIC
jgi:hypothetical protein